MKIGFTGTRRGMTDAQRQVFAELIVRLKPTEFHHGDCVGADDQAASVVARSVSGVRIVVHPPVDESLRAFNGGLRCMMVVRPPRTHLARNRDIVNETDCLIACPLEMEHQPRGGTWYTVDYAAKVGRLTYVVWPDGRIEVRNRREVEDADCGGAARDGD